MGKRPPNECLIFADFNPEWLNTPSPFDELDEEWVSIIIFFVFHIPVANVSARGTTLQAFHWGEKSKNDDFKLLKSRLINYAEMDEDEFKAVDAWIEVKEALKNNNLIDFPLDITKPRLTFRKDKCGVCESLCNHIRNSFAHGRLAFYKENSETYVAMEDIDDKHTVSARLILSKTILKRWIEIIRCGPFETNCELDKKFYLKIVKA